MASFLNTQTIDGNGAFITDPFLSSIGLPFNSNASLPGRNSISTPGFL